jgi:hypothetical protein
MVAYRYSSPRGGKVTDGVEYRADDKERPKLFSLHFSGKRCW